MIYLVQGLLNIFIYLDNNLLKSNYPSGSLVCEIDGNELFHLRVSAPGFTLTMAFREEVHSGPPVALWQRVLGKFRVVSRILRWPHMPWIISLLPLSVGRTGEYDGISKGRLSWVSLTPVEDLLKEGDILERCAPAGLEESKKPCCELPVGASWQETEGSL